MRRKGFTLVELLVVIAIIALLMGILMPALARVRQLAFRMVCGTNLSGIGKAMLIYANDYEDELPRAGTRSSTYGQVIWSAPTRALAYGAQGNTGGTANISSCFYLLVKYAEVTPKSFICKGDTGTSAFSLSDEAAIPSADFELIDAWDFGSDADTHCSYSYHSPFSVYALSISSEPGLAVASERNPWIESPSGAPKTAAEFTQFMPDDNVYNGDSDDALLGNATTHQGDGQNVLYLDSHVDFAKRSFCSLEEDNIFTVSLSTNAGDSKGSPTIISASSPTCRKDSLLVHDFGAGGPVQVTR
jgi:prepilin-type N-terminal cleavage/methylation domain-containing protein